MQYGILFQLPFLLLLGLTLREIVEIADSLDNDSEISGLSDDENETTVNPQLPVARIRLEEEVEDEEDEAVEEIIQPEGKWVRSDIFEPLPPAPRPEVIEDMEMVAPLQRVARYIGNDCFRILAEYTNRRYFNEFGRNLGTRELEIKIFFGAVIIMSYLKYPRIKMYWARKTRVAQIADAMTRNRFFQIRNHLKLMDDTEVTPE